LEKSLAMFGGPGADERDGTVEANSATAHPPAVAGVDVMSATKNSEAWEQATGMGANDFLWKPFTTEVLLCKIQEHLK